MRRWWSARFRANARDLWALAVRFSASLRIAHRCRRSWPSLPSPIPHQRPRHPTSQPHSALILHIASSILSLMLSLIGRSGNIIPPSPVWSIARHSHTSSIYLIERLKSCMWSDWICSGSSKASIAFAQQFESTNLIKWSQMKFSRLLAIAVTNWIDPLEED